MSVLGVLLDKDGTLIDFQDTWGPATHAAIHALAEGDPDVMRAQAEIWISRSTKATSPDLAADRGIVGELRPMWGNRSGGRISPR